MLREKFALTERGAFEFKRGAFFCALANLVMMAPIGVLCMATNDYLDHLSTPRSPSLLLVAILQPSSSYSCSCC